MKAVDLKLLRECWQLRMQLLSIALVVATGIMTVVTMRGSYESLVSAQQAFYSQTRFADVWISLRRAPESLQERIAQLPGVALAETRISRMATLDLEDVQAPAMGRFVSLPESGRPAVNDIMLRQGRYPDPEDSDEVLVNEKFAEARSIRPGDSLRAIINGRARELSITGIAISPEHTYAVPPGGLMPENERYAVVWMSERALGPAFDMDGAFNEASVRLTPEASEQAVISALNNLLAPWGGYGAYGRADQASHMMLQSELDQNRIMGTAIPAVFLSVAIFLVHMVLARLIATQRGEIAVLKAFGYSNGEVAMHYLMFALVAVAAGTVLGTGGGMLLGDAYIGIYRQYFGLPDLEYQLSWSLLGGAVLVSLAGAGTGAFSAIRRAATLPPAEAMRPPAPARFRPGWLERAGLGRMLSTNGRMILRNLERRPVQSLLSSLGVALSVAILVVGLFMFDGIQYMMDLQFRQIQREDVSVGFVENTSSSVRHELARQPGVTRVEGYRTAPARLLHDHRSRDTAIQGMAPDGQLRRLIDSEGRHQPLPADGLVLSALLAQRLAAEPGDTLTAQLLEGQRRRGEVTVAAVIDDLLGVSAYMSLPALERLSGEAGILSGARLAVESSRRDTLYRQLKRIPAVASVASPDSMLDSFEQEMARSIFISVAFLVGFASVIAVGVIYNGARIALSERGRELASLRVMGFHRSEVGFLLLGEQAVITLAAIPAGWLIGYLLAWLMVQSMQTDAFRIPYVMEPGTAMLSAVVTIAAALLSALAVRRRLNRFDLISVLKTRE